MKTKRSS